MIERKKKEERRRRGNICVNDEKRTAMTEKETRREEKGEKCRRKNRETPSNRPKNGDASLVEGRERQRRQ